MTEIVRNTLDILEVKQETIAELKVRAFSSPRGRARLLMHHGEDNPTQEMLIVFHQGSYMPPHRHPAGKSESYHIVEGAMRVCFFDDTGQVIRSIDLEERGSSNPFLYRLSANLWHMPMALSEWLVYHETYTGPFVKERDVEFAPWAPKEDEQEAAHRYLAKFMPVTKKTRKRK